MIVTGHCNGNGQGSAPASHSHPLWINGGGIQLGRIKAEGLPAIHYLKVDSSGGRSEFHATLDQLKVLRDCLADYCGKAEAT